MQTPEALMGSTLFPFSVQNLCPMPCLISPQLFLPHNGIAVRHHHLQHAQVVLLTKSSNLKQAAKCHLRDQTKEKQRQAMVLVEGSDKPRDVAPATYTFFLFLAAPAPGHHCSNSWAPPSHSATPSPSTSSPAPQLKPLLSRAPISGSSATLCPGRETPFPSLAPAASCCSFPHGARIHNGHPSIWGPTWEQPSSPARSSAETTTPTTSESALDLRSCSEGCLPSPPSPAAMKSGWA